ncbi:hypothetical protein M8044_000470 [Columbia Basin potato purple top phytoplasma]|uniref:Uncharacterized protein n=1 Tax=Columbia Basin potato purple top phytoplasma TaxID=307134 RepID=A0ABT5L9R7_9MOLU|nr:hypothetical protein [Columbia Basin potato purple top phytoplasma]
MTLLDILLLLKALILYFVIKIKNKKIKKIF